MKRTLIINDFIWMIVALLVCLGGLNLGFGSFKRPEAGFMPVLCGSFLGLLTFVDLISGISGQWKIMMKEENGWANTSWTKLILTVIVISAYVLLFYPLGFLISTMFLLLFLFRLMEPKPWCQALLASVVTTAIFYVSFKIGLGSQLPRGLLGF